MASAAQPEASTVRVSASSLPSGPTPERFLESYRRGKRQPWDLQRPQREVINAEVEGLFSGDVLDAGCGLGDNAAFLAAKGYQVTAFDFSPEALAEARQRMEVAVPSAKASFVEANAMDLVTTLGEQQFDTVLDSALFHCFAAPERERYVRSLAPHVRPGGQAVLFCFSDKNEDPWIGPHRISQHDLRSAFNEPHWRIDDISETTYESIVHDGGSAAAYRMLATRL